MPAGTSETLVLRGRICRRLHLDQQLIDQDSKLSHLIELVPEKCAANISPFVTDNQPLGVRLFVERHAEQLIRDSADIDQPAREKQPLVRWGVELRGIFTQPLG